MGAFLSNPPDRQSRRVFRLPLIKMRLEPKPTGSPYFESLVKRQQDFCCRSTLSACIYVWPSIEAATLPLRPYLLLYMGIQKAGRLFLCKERAK